MIAAQFSTQRALAWLAGLLCFATIVALSLWLQTGTKRELRALPQPERSALYIRTLATLKGPCSHALDPALTDYCRQQATFITHFPECDHECRASAARILQPSR